MRVMRMRMRLAVVIAAGAATATTAAMSAAAMTAAARAAAMGQRHSINTSRIAWEEHEWASALAIQRAAKSRMSTCRISTFFTEDFWN